MAADFIETGLRAVDLFAPLPLGGDVLLRGEPKSGPRVLGTELALRLSRRPGGGLRTTVFLDAAVADAADYEAEFRETVPAADLVVADAITPDRFRGHLASRPFSLGNAVFAVSHGRYFIADFLGAVAAGRKASPFTKLTSFVVTEAEVAGEFDAEIRTIRALAAEGVYPALDVGASFSTAKHPARLAPDHPRVAQLAREAIGRAARDLQPGRIQDETWAYHTDSARRPSLQALLFLSQPFFCAEAYTGMPSAVVPLAETVAGFRAILEGRHAGAPVRNFRFRNSLEGIAG